MIPQAEHDVLPKQTADEFSRHSFLVSFKNALHGDLRQGLRHVYDSEAEPSFQAREGRPPQDRHDVRSVMEDQPTYRWWSALQRAQQDLYVDSTQACVDRQIETLTANARALSRQPRHGSLHLNPNLKIPRYQTEIDQHCVPGSFFLELLDGGDVMAGARYDIGIYMYTMGTTGPYNDGQARSIIAWIKSRYPDFRPRRILDMGCTGGACTLPYVAAFPGAEVHGIDLAAPCLRYAHARAEALGIPAHFSQQNAEATDFPDGHFDLIVSHILLHETSRRAVFNIMQESHRLLAPGGLVLHGEVPVRNSELDPYDQFMRDWSTFNNNEPFWGTLHDMDFAEPATKAGFARENVIDDFVPSVDGMGFGGGAWLVLGAHKPAHG